MKLIKSLFGNYLVYFLWLFVSQTACSNEGNLSVLLKPSSALVAANSKLVYFVKVNNLGNSDVTNVVVKSQLPIAAQFKSASPLCRFNTEQDKTAKQLTCKIEKISENQSVDFSITVQTPVEPQRLDAKVTVKFNGADIQPRNNVVRVQTKMLANDMTAQTLEDSLNTLQTARLLPQAYIEMAVKSVLIASRLNRGQLTMTGTLTQNKTGAFAYSAQPSNVLRLLLTRGEQIKFNFRELNGELFSDVEAFIRNPYVIDFTVQGNEAADSVALNISSQPDQQNQTRQLHRVSGNSLIQQVPWNIELTIQSRILSAVDGSIAELDNEQLIDGELSAPTLGLLISENRYSRFHLVNTVENIHEEFDSLITLNNKEYRLQGAIFMAFKNARPVDTDQWTIQGNLTEGNTVLSNITLSNDLTGIAAVVTIDGEEIPLIDYRF
ncbi:DUF11 domain-containing protein [Methylocucumis oryzae]|uniref:DUF11 domain-containing protein n=1 Tax=Methylocucumis oryzae TaxID=1632867 RepID=A0A0F3IFS9_9GAMM|nr:DUF11 domain-containing protein [Methylocucumis oryzae]KJV05596.1 hypothetical protein VZ94_17045 [Methylocucumis oryzae]